MATATTPTAASPPVPDGFHAPFPLLPAHLVPDRCIPSRRYACPLGPFRYLGPMAEPAVAGEEPIPSCRLDAADLPEGTIGYVPGSGAVAGTGPLLRYRVGVEAGLALDAACFAAAVEGVLGDGRGWIGTGEVAFRRVDTEPADFVIVLASPATTDRLCAPLQTNGRYSCRNGNLVVLNARRWEEGADAFGTDVDGYRRYMVNHEVGHRLGRHHLSCPASGEPAPVMMPQTKGVGGCTPNPWPTPDELTGR